MNKYNVNVAVGLVHWPVLDKAGSTVCTNITNFDIHDISRACCTYGVSKYYLINKLNEQQMFASRVLDHWKTGYGLKYNPMRATALNQVEVVGTLPQAIADFDPQAQVIATAARDLDDLEKINFTDLRSQVQNNSTKSIFIVFGTGFGLHKDALDSCTHLLEPIKGASKDDYRHLSVRSAVSICLDRIFGV
ncbi:MAG: RNA methyltransferase [Bdellovibrionaceae bacterium]|jgi:hypothetical protein|nr:RNA methyltransferase [Pseudobdellovibrionaceae bacterium]